MIPATQEQLARLWTGWYSTVVDMIRFRGPTQEEAEDIVQAAFVRLGEKLERGTAKADPALLRTIADGIRIDRYRDAHPKQTLADGTEVPIEFVSFDALRVKPEDEVIVYREHRDFDFAPSFDRAMRRLPTEERAAYSLVTLRGLSQPEAAEVLGVSQQTVSRRCIAAHTSIRKELAA